MNSFDDKARCDAFFARTGYDVGNAEVLQLIAEVRSDTLGSCVSLVRDLVSQGVLEPGERSIDGAELISEIRGLGYMPSVPMISEDDRGRLPTAAEMDEALPSCSPKEVKSRIGMAKKELAKMQSSSHVPSTKFEEGHIVLARGIVQDVCTGFASIAWDTKCEDECTDLVPVDALRHECWTLDEIEKVKAAADKLHSDLEPIGWKCSRALCDWKTEQLSGYTRRGPCPKCECTEISFLYPSNSYTNYNVEAAEDKHRGVEAGVAQTGSEGPITRSGTGVGNRDLGRASGEEQRSCKPLVPGSIPGPSLDSPMGRRPPDCDCDGYATYTHYSFCSYIKKTQTESQRQARVANVDPSTACASEATLVHCWRCKHDVPEETTVCNAGIGTQCKDAKTCRGRWYGPYLRMNEVGPTDFERLEKNFAELEEWRATGCPPGQIGNRTNDARIPVGVAITDSVLGPDGRHYVTIKPFLDGVSHHPKCEHGACRKECPVLLASRLRPDETLPKLRRGITMDDGTFITTDEIEVLRQAPFKIGQRVRHKNTGQVGEVVQRSRVIVEVVLERTSYPRRFEWLAENLEVVTPHE